MPLQDSSLLLDLIATTQDLPFHQKPLRYAVLAKYSGMFPQNQINGECQKVAIEGSRLSQNVPIASISPLS